MTNSTLASTFKMPRPAVVTAPPWQEWTMTDSVRALLFLLLHAPLALAFSATLNAPIEPTRFGVFRM